MEGVMFFAQSTPDRQLTEALELLRRVPCGHAAVSLNALPHVLPVRHLVGDGDVLLRTNYYGMDDADLLDGTVVAYEAHTSAKGHQGHQGRQGAPVDRGSAPSGDWSVQLIGVVHTFVPTEEDQRRFGPQQVFEDGHDTPVHVRLTPQFATVRHARPDAAH